MVCGIWWPTSLEEALPQGSALPHPFPFFTGPVAALDAFPPRQKLPGKSRVFKRGVVEEVEAAVIGQRRLSPGPVGDHHVARLVWRVGAGRQKDRLASVVCAAGKTMWQEAAGALVPENSVEPGEIGLVLGDYQQPTVGFEYLLRQACDHLLGRC